MKISITLITCSSSITWLAMVSTTITLTSSWIPEFPIHCIASFVIIWLTSWIIKIIMKSIIASITWCKIFTHHAIFRAILTFSIGLIPISIPYTSIIFTSSISAIKMMSSCATITICTIWTTSTISDTTIYTMHLCCIPISRSYTWGVGCVGCILKF